MSKPLGRTKRTRTPDGPMLVSALVPADIAERLHACDSVSDVIRQALRFWFATRR